ncbi:MAG: hypothetical protein KC636_30360, partial [Myxococcales bacterium]|nr:hypothetical protein [Myxococcales bacterium]
QRQRQRQRGDEAEQPEERSVCERAEHQAEPKSTAISALVSPASIAARVRWILCGWVVRG